MKKKQIGIIILLLVGAAATAGIIKYNKTDFDPDVFSKLRDRRANQVLAQGKDSSLEEQTSKDSRLWEEQQKAKKNHQLKNQPSSTNLYHTIQIQDPSDKEAKLEDQSSDSFAQVYRRADSNKNSSSKTVTVVTNDPSSSKKIVTDTRATEHIPSSERTTEDSTQAAPDSSSTTDSTSTDSTSSDQTNSDTKGDDSGSNDKDNKNDTDDGKDQPSTPDDSKTQKEDPDKTVPSLPADDSVINADPYPGDDKVDQETKDQSLSLMIIGLMNDDDKKNKLYQGEYLNDQRVLCSVLVYVCVDGTPKYRLTELNDNFKVGEYPEQVGTDPVDLTFYYRPGESYDWIEGSYTAPVDYRAKVLLQSYKEGEYVEQYMVPNDQDFVPLFSFYADMVSESPHNYFEAEPVTSLFVGWSEDGNEADARGYYQVTKTGAVTLYPATVQALDSMYQAELMGHYFTLGMYPYFKKYQMLTNVFSDSDTLTIPQGIQVVDLPYEINWETFTVDYKQFATVKVPESVLMLGTDTTSEKQSDSFIVTKAYEVDPDNIRYSSYDGMLLDKEQTVIYDIPTEKTSVTIPETVDDIHFSMENQISEIHFLKDKPIDLSFDDLYGVTLYVPAEDYLKYLSAWGKHPGNDSNELVAEDGEIEDFVEDDEAIYSADGKTLLSVKSSVSGVFIVKDGVETITKGALENGDAIDLLLLPASVRSLPDGSLTENAPEKVVFLGSVPPEIEKDAFASGTMVQILSSAKTAYETAFSTVEASLTFVYKTYQYVAQPDGFVYLEEEADEKEAAGAILLRAPQSLTYYSKDSIPSVSVKEIAAKAFSKCQQLMIAELPPETKIIGKKAFYGCSGLEGVISHAKDTLTVRDDALEQTASLRFVAYDAAELTSYNYQGRAMVFGAWGGSGYDGVYRFSTSYYLEDQGEAKLLYGVAPDEQGNPTKGRYVLGATSNVSGKIVLDPNATEMTADVFMNCTNAFTVEGLSQMISIDENAFANSGLQGDVSLTGGLVYLGDGAFSGCSGITSVELDGTRLDKNVYLSPFGSRVFSYCTGLQEAVLTGEGNYDIGTEAFSGCISLTQIDLSETTGIKKIGAGAFFNTGLASITIPACVQSVGYALFDLCSSLESVTFLRETPVELQGYGYHQPFLFGDCSIAEGGFHVPEGCEQAYLTSWTYQMLGYSEDEKEELTEEEIAQSEQQVRAMLGMKEQEDSEEETTEAEAQTGEDTPSPTVSQDAVAQEDEE